MALNTGNAFLDAIGGTPWPMTAANTSPADGALILTVYFDNEISEGHSVGGAWTEAEKSAFWGAMRVWTSVANVRFLEVDTAAAADMIERKVTDKEAGTVYDLTAAGAHNTPDQSEHVGIFNTDQNWTPGSLQPGGAMFETIVHELGHALGLAHPHDTGMGTGLFPGVDEDAYSSTGSFGLNSRPYTIMSYNGAPGSDPDVPDRGFCATPGAFDIAAIQLMYGAVGSNTGDTVYTLRDDAPGVSYSCIWDTGGIDTIRYDGSHSATINLNAATLENRPGGGGYLSSVNGVNGGFTIAADITDYDGNGNLGVIIENAVGGSGADLLSGNAVNNILEGRGGADTLKGFGGADTLIGGTGNDTYVLGDVSPFSFRGMVVGESYDRVVEAAGEGIDTVKVSRATGVFDHTSYTLGDNIENGEVIGAGAFDLTGNGLDNMLSGNAAANTLTGLGGDDILFGDEGRDRLIGGDGDDIYMLADISPFSSGGMFFGEGYDTVTELAGGGVDTVLVTHAQGFLFDHTQYTLGDNIENGGVGGNDAFDLTGNELDNILEGNSAANTLSGLGGSDTLDGRSGRDVLVGGAGDDTYVLGDVSTLSSGALLFGETWDTVVEAAGEGIDTVKVGRSAGLVFDHTQYTLGDNIERGIVTGDGAFSITGNDLDNQLDGNAAANTLAGAGGADVLQGFGGDDILDGGLGADVAVFQGARSQYTITALDNGQFQIVDQLAERDGTDILIDVETLRFADGDVTAASLRAIIGTPGNDMLVGDAGDNDIQGLAGDDVLVGGAGADRLSGGADRDILYVDAADTVIDGGDGFDIVYADASTAATGLRFALAGTNVEAVFGNAGNDVLDASSTSDYTTMLFGGGGDDVLIGGSNGNYTLQGGSGTDTVVLPGNQADYVIDGQPGGWPSWMTAINSQSGAVYWLQTVERLQFDDGTVDVPVLPINRLGTDAADVLTASDGGETLYGMGGDDRLTGGAGNDIIDGGAGADQLIGGDGNDAFFIDSNDTLVDGGAGYDSVYADDTQGAPAALHFSLAGTGVEFVYGGMGGDVIDASGVASSVELWGQWGDDILTGGDGDDRLLGDEWLPGGGDDQLFGGAGNDRLYGGNGNDRMAGGSGNDTYYVDDAGDVVVEDAGQGNDVVYATVDFTLAENVETLYLQGTAANGAGNSGANSLYGNALDNVLSGFGGDDQLFGGAGNDRLLGGGGIDRLDGGAGADRLTGGWGRDVFIFRSGEAQGDVITDFAGNRAYAGDSLQFEGFGTADQGATFTRVGIDQWQIHSGLDGHNELITLSNYASVHATDFTFV